MGASQCLVADTTVFWQPLVDLVTGTVIGYEALGRLAGQEDAGFPAVERAFRTRQHWRPLLIQLQTQALDHLDRIPPETLLFINVHHQAARALTATLATLTPQQLRTVVLELPERDTHFALWEQTLAPFREAGVRIAVDDWGSGTADPLRLINLRPDWVKLDVSLIRQVGHNADMDRLLQLLLRWTDPGRTQVVAEGVESPAQVLRLRELGVRYGQGYALGRPGPAWPISQGVPRPAVRLGALDTVALTLGHFYDLHDEDLRCLAVAQAWLVPLTAQLCQDLTAWIAQRAIGTTLLAHSTPERFSGVLTHHITSLLRGYLGPDDIDRNVHLVDTHLRIGIDFSWYLMAHRELEARFARALRPRGEAAVADAVRRLLVWDSGVAAHLYQQRVDHDTATGLLTATAFRARASAALADSLYHRREGALVHFDWAHLPALAPHRPPADREEAWTTLGQLLNHSLGGEALLGRTADLVLHAWIPSGDRQGLIRFVETLRPQVHRDLGAGRWQAGVAWLGPDGVTLEALQTAALHHLLPAP